MQIYCQILISVSFLVNVPLPVPEKLRFGRGHDCLQAAIIFEWDT